MKWFEVTYKIGKKMDVDLVPAKNEEIAKELIENKFSGEAEVLEVVKQ